MAGYRPRVQCEAGHPRAWAVLNTVRFSKQKQGKFMWQTPQNVGAGLPPHAPLEARLPIHPQRD